MNQLDQVAGKARKETSRVPEQAGAKHQHNVKPNAKVGT